MGRLRRTVARLIDPSLAHLSSIIAEMGDIAVQCVSHAIDSYVAGRDTTELVRGLSDRLRARYDESADLTFETILKYQPVAHDFRLMRSSIEVSYAYWRLGRYAYDIARVRGDFGDIGCCRTGELRAISESVRSMIKEATVSFATLDVGRASAIQSYEEFVDMVYHRRLSQLVKLPDTRCALAEALLLRYLERIADHAVFMSDAVNYIVTGKHRPAFLDPDMPSQAAGSAGRGEEAGADAGIGRRGPAPSDGPAAAGRLSGGGGGGGGGAA